MQFVRPTPSAAPNDWKEGIIVECRWEEAGLTEPMKRPHPARWVYEVQIGDDSQDLFECWFAEDDLLPR